MARLTAGILILLALTRAYFDWQLSKLNETEIVFQPIGQIWFDLHRNSLLALQPAVERYLSPVIWENAIGPMLLWPLAPTLFFLGLFFVFIAIFRVFRY